MFAVAGNEHLYTWESFLGTSSGEVSPGGTEMVTARVCSGVFGTCHLLKHYLATHVIFVVVFRQCKT